MQFSASILFQLLVLQYPGSHFCSITCREAFKKQAAGGELLNQPGPDGILKLQAANDENVRARRVCVIKGCGKPVLRTLDGQESMFCNATCKDNDVKTPSHSNDPLVIILNSAGTAVHLFPNVDLKFGHSHVRIRRGEQEQFAVKRVMRLSVKPDSAHLSMALHPFKDFRIQYLLRLENWLRWTECQQQKLASSGPKWLYLFHGTSHYATQQIERGEFIKSISGDFGEGIYLADISTAAHLFAMDKVLCPFCYKLGPSSTTPAAPALGTKAPTFMKFDRKTNTPNVKCASCSRTDIAKKCFHRCTVCSKTICRHCGDKFVNGDGFCDMLLCLVNVGEVVTSKPSSGTYDTYKAQNSRGWTEWIVSDKRRVYPCYRIRYRTDTAFIEAAKAAGTAQP